jgi:prophage regulatory protein
MDIDKCLRIKQVSEITGLSRATIYNMEKIGSFPKKIVLGERAVAWRESDIRSWMDSRIAITKIGREAKPGRPQKGPRKKQTGLQGHEDLGEESSVLPLHNLPNKPQSGVCSDDPVDELIQPLTSEQQTALQMRRKLAAKKAREMSEDVVKRTRKRMI